jgi:TolB-like protein
MKKTGEMKKTGNQVISPRRARQVFLAAVIVLALCSAVQALEQAGSPIDGNASVALMPLIKGQNPEGQGETLTCPMGRFCYDETGLKDDADQSLTAMIQEELLARLESRAVSQETVQKAFESIRYGFEEKTPLDVVMEMGAKLNVDYMLVGNVWRYQERIGGDYGVDRAASVSFALYLVSAKDGEEVWAQTFSETQKSLSENLLRAGQFFKRGAKWLTARELARAGLTEVMKTFPLHLN